LITNIKSIYFQLVEHEKNVGCNKSASNPNAEPKAVDLPTAVGDLSQLLLQKKMAAASRAAALLRELLDSMTPVETTARVMAEEGGGRGGGSRGRL